MDTLSLHDPLFAAYVIAATLMIPCFRGEPVNRTSLSVGETLVRVNR